VQHVRDQTNGLAGINNQLVSGIEPVLAVGVEANCMLRCHVGMVVAEAPPALGSIYARIVWILMRRHFKTHRRLKSPRVDLQKCPRISSLV